MKKYKVLLLFACILIIVVVATCVYWNIVSRERTQNKYISLLKDAKTHFADFNESKKTNDYNKGKHSFTEATKLLYSHGEHWDIFEERETMIAVATILESNPTTIEANMEYLLIAFDDILSKPFHRISYGELLNFLNHCNHVG